MKIIKQGALNRRQEAVNFLFYPLVGHHTVFLAGTGCTKYALEECLKEGLSMGEIKTKLFNILHSLDILENRASKAAKTAERIRRHLCELVA